MLKSDAEHVAIRCSTLPSSIHIETCTNMINVLYGQVVYFLRNGVFIAQAGQFSITLAEKLSHDPQIVLFKAMTPEVHDVKRFITVIG